MNRLRQRNSWVTDPFAFSMNEPRGRHILECGGKGGQGARHRFGGFGHAIPDRKRRRRSPLHPRTLPPHSK